MAPIPFCRIQSFDRPCLITGPPIVQQIVTAGPDRASDRGPPSGVNGWSRNIPSGANGGNRDIPCGVNSGSCDTASGVNVGNRDTVTVASYYLYPTSFHMVW